MGIILCSVRWDLFLSLRILFCVGLNGTIRVDRIVGDWISVVLFYASYSFSSSASSSSSSPFSYFSCIRLPACFSAFQYTSFLSVLERDDAFRKPLVWSFTLFQYCASHFFSVGVRSGAAQLVEALRYKPEGGRYDHSGRTMALGSTQPLTETSTRNISW